MIPSGRVSLVGRLVMRDIRRRWTQSLLLVVMLMSTTTTLTLALALAGTSEQQFSRTRIATKGPDLTLANGPGPGLGRPSLRQFAFLSHDRAIAAQSGPFPVAFTRLTAPGIDVPVDAEGRNQARASVDQPLLSAGHWLSSGGVVIEHGLATSLGLHIGQAISLGRRRFRVVGIAFTTARPFYPAAAPGLVWVSSSDVATLASATEPLGYQVSLKLARHASPDAAAALINRFVMAAGRVASSVDDWQDIRQHDYKAIALDQKVLLVGSWLLALLATASIAVLVGGRVAEQTKRVGLLKAVGASPRLIVLVLVAENVILALVAAIGGLVAGALLAPLLSKPGDGLLGSAASPQVTAGSAAIVTLVALILVIVATVAPALRATRATTIRALNEPAHPPQRRALLIKLSGLLPVPVLLGLRLVARRPRRTMLTAGSLAVAVAMVVAALVVERDLQVTKQGQATVGFFTTSANVQGANHVLLLLSVVLVILAAISVTFTAWATVVDARIATALARALGATPRQVSAGLTTAQLLPGFAAACIGIPAGLLLYELAGGHLNEARPPLSWLMAVIPLTVIAVAAVTAIPARIGARRPVAEVLRAE
jgi:putative ABC transport system permease protein